jgi:NAD(P)-dependent dehydrogenase (short-subunit alcohol dehydrogenase family)
MKELFDLSGKIAVITGGSGFLGRRHAEAIARFGGVPVLIDVNRVQINEVAADLQRRYAVNCAGFVTDITDERQVEECCRKVKEHFGQIDVLINNAANNPRVDEAGQLRNAFRLEDFSLEQWRSDLAVGLTGAFLCAKYFGTAMAASGGGSIINISSDLGIIAPNQNLYKQEGIPERLQSVKPVTYSVIKTGLIGLTRYLATYWPEQGVRCNAVCPGGVLNGQGEEFVRRVASLIPMGRMAGPDEFQGVVVFLASGASSYVNGAVIAVDGGRSAW